MKIFLNCEDSHLSTKNMVMQKSCIRNIHCTNVRFAVCKIDFLVFNFQKVNFAKKK